MLKPFDKASTVSSTGQLRVDAEQRRSIKHICGQCGKKFMRESLYLSHLCPASGTAPTQTLGFEEHKIASAKSRTKRLSEKEIVAAVRVARRKRKNNA